MKASTGGELVFSYYKSKIHMHWPQRKYENVGLYAATKINYTHQLKFSECKTIFGPVTNMKDLHGFHPEIQLK